MQDSDSSPKNYAGLQVMKDSFNYDQTAELFEQYFSSLSLSPQSLETTAKPAGDSSSLPRVLEGENDAEANAVPLVETVSVEDCEEDPAMKEAEALPPVNFSARGFPDGDTHPPLQTQTDQHPHHQRQATPPQRAQLHSTFLAPHNHTHNRRYPAIAVTEQHQYGKASLPDQNSGPQKTGRNTSAKSDSIGHKATTSVSGKGNKTSSGRMRSLIFKLCIGLALAMGYFANKHVLPYFRKNFIGYGDRSTESTLIVGGCESNAASIGTIINETDDQYQGDTSKSTASTAPPSSTLSTENDDWPTDDQNGVEGEGEEEEEPISIGSLFPRVACFLLGCAGVLNFVEKSNISTTKKASSSPPHKKSNVDLTDFEQLHHFLTTQSNRGTSTLGLRNGRKCRPPQKTRGKDESMSTFLDLSKFEKLTISQLKTILAGFENSGNGESEQKNYKCNKKTLIDHLATKYYDTLRSKCTKSQIMKLLKAKGIDCTSSFKKQELVRKAVEAGF